MTDPQRDDPETADACGCSEAQLERIHEYLDGALTVEDVRSIAEHMDDCPDCSHEHDLERVIRSAVRRSCTETAPQALRSSIMSRINEACGRPGDPSRSRSGSDAAQQPR